MRSDMLYDKPNYIYFLVDPFDDKVRYVGLSNNPSARLIWHTGDEQDSKIKTYWIQELKRKGAEPKLIVSARFDDRIEGELIEKHLIEEFSKNQVLCNTIYNETLKTARQ